MNNFEYYNPVQVIFGDDALDKIGHCGSELGKKALIVTYTQVDFFGDLIQRVHNQLESKGIKWVDYLGITANPTLAQCEKGIELCLGEGCDFVIGIGGGSAMDSAKLIAVGSQYSQPLRKLVSFSHSGALEQIQPEKALPTIMIPTLPATGSEMNPTAVVTDEEAGKKSYLWAPCCLYPKYAIVDPSLSATLPPYQTACAAIDTMAHILESFFNGDSSVDLTLLDEMQIGVMKTVLGHVEKVIAEPDNIQLRGTMQWASAIALNGWLSSGTYGWAPMHQMGHVLSARYHVTHGATLATMILAWLTFFADREDNARYEAFAKGMFNMSIKDAVDHLEKLFTKLGVETKISQFGVTEDAVVELVADVVAVSFGADGKLGSVPALEAKDIQQIYKLSL